MYNNVLLSLALLAFLAISACNAPKSQDTNAESENQIEESETVEDTSPMRGEAFDYSSSISYEDFLSKMTEKDSLTEVVVKGNVTSVCQMKGCWMTLQADDEASETFVQFYDYGFFMPIDLAGKEVIMKGKGYYETTSVEDLRHFAEDEGATKEEIEAITEPKIERKFLATGVYIPSLDTKE